MAKPRGIVARACRSYPELATLVESIEANPDAAREIVPRGIVTRACRTYPELATLVNSIEKRLDEPPLAVGVGAKKRPGVKKTTRAKQR